MDFRVPDWLTNVLGVQSLTQFGAASSPAQHVIQNDIDWSQDCGAFISSTQNSQSASGVVWIKDNFAVVPEEYENSGIASSWLNAKTETPHTANCLGVIKSHSFIGFDPAFSDFLGATPLFETIQSFDGDDANHVHEAPIYLASTNELIFADTSVQGWLWGTNIDTHVVRKLQTDPPLANVNGGTYHAHPPRLYFTTNGGTTRAVWSCNLPTRTPIPETLTCHPVTNSYHLAKFSSPNDLIFTSANNLIFTDPPYGWAQAWPGVDHPELPSGGIYHFNTTSKAILALSNSDVLNPNGLALSPDEKILYIAESNSTSGRPIGVHPASVRNVYAFKFDASVPRMWDRQLVHFCEAGWPDGLRITQSGLLLVAGMGGVDVVDASRGGVLLGKLNVGDDIIFNLESAAEKKGMEGVWLLTGKKGVYKVTVKEGGLRKAGSS